MNKNKTKKIALFVCVAIMVMASAIALVGCKDKGDGIPKISDLNAIIVANPQVYEMHETVKVNTLISTADLFIEKQNGKFLAKYKYTNRRYSIMEVGSLPNNAIITEGGVKYYDGMSVGIQEEKGVRWGDEKATDITKMSIRLSDDVLEAGYTLTADGEVIQLVGVVKATQVEKLLGIKGTQTVNIDMSFNIAKKRVTSIMLNYVKGANSCEVNISLGYTPCATNIPTEVVK